MKTLVIYYSWSGHTKTIAEALAQAESADIAEIKDVKRPGKLKAYLSGCRAAKKGKIWPTQDLDRDVSAYERIVVLAPVWAGRLAPQINGIWKRIPKGKTVAVKAVSKSGKSKCQERIEILVKQRRCTLESFEDVKA